MAERAINEEMTMTTKTHNSLARSLALGVGAMLAFLLLLWGPGTDSASAKAEIYAYEAKPSNTQAGAHPDLLTYFRIGNRYTQGFGVHQGFGVLADDAGNDVYWSQVAANQGGAWDVGAGLLIDRGGDDTYRADGLAQGGASMQGIALLVDLDGRDRYDAAGGATQGQSGGNEYHFHSTGALSFSLLLDLGGKEDLYSRERANNATAVTGTANAADPKNSDQHGVVIDR